MHAFGNLEHFSAIRTIIRGGDGLGKERAVQIYINIDTHL